VRRLLTWAVVTLGIAALVRGLRRRSVAAEQETSESVEAVPEDDPADELRRKLAESRAEEEAAPPASTTAPVTVDERRAAVHDAGRSALDEMRDTDGA
jgi:hypothetical protein